MVDALAGWPIPNLLGVDLRGRGGRAFLVQRGRWVLLENDAAFFRDFVARRPRWGAGRDGDHAQLDAFRVMIPDEGTWELARRRMRNFIVNTTDRCNSGCRVCFKKEYPEEDLNLDDLRQLLGRIGRHKNVVLSGGECTTRDDLPRLIAEVRRAGHVPTIYTNGLRLAERGFLGALRAAGLRRIHFSLDGLTPAVHAELRGDAGQLATKLEALDTIGACGDIDVHLSTLVVPRTNGDQVVPLLRFALARHGFVRSIYFMQNNIHDGVYAVDAGQWTTTDILRPITAAWPELDAGYWLAYERLKLNLAQQARRLRLPFHSPTTGVVLQARGGELRLPFTRHELDAQNAALESWGAAGLALVAPTLLRRVAPLRLLRSLLERRFDLRLVRDVFYLDIHRITTRSANLPLSSDTIDVAKQNGRLILRHGCL
jgi:hypothetical protein